MAPVRLKKILVSCYLDQEQLDRLRELSHRKGEPMTYYMREGIALVLDKYAEKTKQRRNKS